jgi:hypothetical protein
MATLPYNPTAIPTDTLPLTMPKLRALLAERRVSCTQLARASHLSRTYVSHLLTERRAPGQLATIKLTRGLAALGLDRQAAND